MSETTVEQCKKTVGEPPHYIHRHRCTRPGKYDGYCWQHKKKAERQAAEGAGR